MFKFSKQIAAQLKSQIINQASPFPKTTSQFQLTPRNINKRNSRLIRRMSSSIMGLVELCKVNSYCPPQIVDILQENHEHSKDDISKLQTFLSNSQIYSDLKESNIDTQIINKILIAFIPFLKLDKIPPNMCLCSYGATPHKVYILLEGNIRIIKPISNDFYYNGFDYFCEIMKIKYATLYENNIKLNNELLLEKTLSTNYHIYPINKDEIHLLKFIVFHEMYMKHIVKAIPHSKDNNNSNTTNNNNTNSSSSNNEIKELNILIDLLKQCYLSQKDFNIKYPHSIAYLPYIKSAITSELNQRLNDKIINKYSFINDTEKRSVQIYSYSSTYLNIEGDFIGETSYSNNSVKNILTFPKYSEYAVSIDHSYCVSIPFDVFYQNINNEKEKIKTKEIGFLLQTHILRPIHFRKFKRAYFHNFILKQYNKGDLIINDTITHIGKVYIIKEGEIQITIKKSILSLIKIQKKLIALLKEYNCKWERDVVYNEKEITNRKDCNKVYNYKLVCLGEKDVFGNGLVYYNVDNFYNVVVVSEKAKVYEVSKDNFMKMAEGDVDVVKRFKLFGIKKIKNLLDRINNILSYVLYYGSWNECQEEMMDENDNEGINEVNNNNGNNNVIQMRFTKYSLNYNNNNNSTSGNVLMKTPKFSLTTNQLNKKVLCCNSPVRIGKSTTIKEYLSFTKNYHSSRNDYNNNNVNCHQHINTNTNTFTIESTIENVSSNNNNNNNMSSNKKYRSFRIRKQNKKKNNKTYMNRYMYFEDKLLKYSKMLVQTSSYVNDNSINKKYFESTLSNVGRCLSTDNNKNSININKYKTKSQSTTHTKINIKKNNLKNIKTSPYLTHTMTTTLTSMNNKGSTLELKLPNITEMVNSTRQSLPVHQSGNSDINNEEDECTLEVNIQPKDGMKGKKMGFNVNNIKINKNIIYKKVIRNKLGY